MAKICLQTLSFSSERFYLPKGIFADT